MLFRSSQVLAVQLKAFPAIKTADEYTRAGALLITGRGVLKQLDDAYDDIIKKAHEAHKTAVAKKASYADPIKGGTKFLEGLMDEYDAGQERKRLAEERRLQEEARKAEEERRLQEAVELEQSGNKQESEELISAPVEAPVVILSKTTPKVVGLSFQTRWDAEVIDFPALVKAVAEGKVSINALLPDQTFLRKQAESLRDTLRIPGVRAYSRRV